MNKMVKGLGFRPLLFRVLKSRPSFIRTMSVEKENLVETESIGNVFLIGINRPEKRNCVNTPTANQLYESFQQFEKNEDLWVAVLYGKGGNFCAGFDLSQLASSPENIDLPGAEDMGGRGPMGPSRMMFSKPVIAAVSGYAVAGGLELSLMCDMRVAEESAIFGVFCRRFGVPLIDGGTVRLPHLIGMSRAMDMILTGRGVPAKEAYEMGLANRVVPNGTAVGEAVKLAQSLCKFPQKCMRADRISAYNSIYNAISKDEAFKFEYENGIGVIQKESVQGAKKFVSGVGKSGSFNLGDKSKL